MARRTFLAQLAGLPFLALGMKPQESKKPLNIMMKGAWGPDDPTRASFPFLHGLALADAGHNVQIYLLADATALMRTSTVNAIFPVGWPPLSETLAKVVAKHIPIYACGACSLPATSRKRTWIHGERNSAVRQSLSRWWSGRTGLSSSENIAEEQARLAIRLSSILRRKWRLVACSDKHPPRTPHALISRLLGANGLLSFL